jgi:filamentous hemagglutinin family protein
MKRHGSMNHIYRLVWSQVLNGWVAVAETARGRGKGSRRKLIAAALALSASLAQAAPVGGQLVSGAGSISQSGATTTVTQSSQNLSLTWKGFNIAPQETVNFVQPSASAIAVNRIFDTQGTQVLGHLNANGQVYLINPNGVLFGQGAQVNVGGLVASTLDLNEASLSGNQRLFSGNGTGSVVNQGTINAAAGGYVALLGNHVSNQGVIVAQLGSVALGAGSAATLTFSGNSLVNMRVNQSVLDSLAENGGLIRADGGLVVMSAGAKDALLASVVNNTGVIEAKGVSAEGGVIRLEGDYVTQGGTLDASGKQGGNIAINARAILDAGTANASGTAGNGGAINYHASDAIVATSAAHLQANGTATGGSVHLQGDNSLFSSAKIEATGQQGGTIDALGNRVTLAAATLDASGTTKGGLIRVGGDFHGTNPNLVNAQTTTLNGATALKADGGNGQVVVWSEQQTDYYGSISANQAGRIEVSSKGSLNYAGQADAGVGGTLLLDPANIIISASAGPAAFALLDPHAAAGNAFGSQSTLLGTTVNGVFQGNGKVVITSYGDSLGGSNAGAVYLFDTNTGALISALTGSHANDSVGSYGIIALANGNYVVNSRNWNGNMGAATFGSSTSGVSGAVSAGNSLVGSTAGDRVGNRGIITLANGNYVVGSRNWHGNMGAVTFGSGSSGVSGAISASNSLVGSTAGDYVGSGGITLLSNGNYVVDSSNWNGNRGAVTFGSGTSGVVGAVSAGNSLVGSTAGASIGNDGITALANGNYVVSSSGWNGGMGAATFGSGTSGVVGAVSASNSLVGSTAYDSVGSDGITALANGNYVVSSSNWNGGMGAVTFGSGTSGVVGAVSASNSLVGSTAYDYVGGDGITALTNGNYVVRSSNWNGGMGAATFGSGSSGVSGAVSASNSLVGSTAGDSVGGDGITALANGNYVVRSSNWNGGMGAATFGSGNSGVSGAVSASNSLVGSTVNDSVGIDGITVLANGNYVVRSSYWNGQRGAATFGSGTSGVSGAVSAGNSLVGSTAYDRVGRGGITLLSNGNYVVSSSYWNGAIGAATFGNGTSGVAGAVAAGNSLVGSTAGDYVGSGGITALANGNYVVSSANWNGNKGAASFGSGTSGVVGVVSAGNSLVGSTASDYVGSGRVTALANGNYVVSSSNWNGGMGAATFGSGTSGVSGAVSASNSLVGSTAGDYVGNTGIYAFANGNYVVASGNWSGNKGAATYGNGTSGVSGVVSASNSLVGTTANDYVGSGGEGGGNIMALANGNYLVASSHYAAGAGQVLIGTPGDLGFATGTGSSMSFNPSALSATLAAGTAVTLQASNDITVNAAINVAGAGGGAFTLEAGRNINLNSSITTANSNFTAVAGAPGAISADRLAGTPSITLGVGASINAGTGNVELAAIGGNFVNNSGSASPITANKTRIYSTNVAGDTFGGMDTSSHFFNVNYAGGSTPGVTLPASGQTFLFAFVPTVIVTANASSKAYGSADPTLSYTATGLLLGDAINSFTGTLVRASGETAGSYAIGQGSLANPLGYAIGYAGNKFTIAGAPMPTPIPTPGTSSTGNSPVLPSAPVLNAMAQLESGVLSYQTGAASDAFNPSTTIVVTQLSSSATGTASTPVMDNGAVANAMTTIGGTGPALHIVNGGMKLPNNIVNVNE